MYVHGEMFYWSCFSCSLMADFHYQLGGNNAAQESLSKDKNLSVTCHLSLHCDM